MLHLHNTIKGHSAPGLTCSFNLSSSSLNDEGYKSREQGDGEEGVGGMGRRSGGVGKRRVGGAGNLKQVGDQKSCGDVGVVVQLTVGVYSGGASYGAEAPVWGSSTGSLNGPEDFCFCFLPFNFGGSTGGAGTLRSFIWSDVVKLNYNIRNNSNTLASSSNGLQSSKVGLLAVASFTAVSYVTRMDITRAQCQWCYSPRMDSRSLDWQTDFLGSQP